MKDHHPNFDSQSTIDDGSCVYISNPAVDMTIYGTPTRSIIDTHHKIGKKELEQLQKNEITRIPPAI